MHYQTHTKIWNCRERMFTLKIKRWDGQSWCEIPVEKITQFRHRITAFGTLHEGDIIARWDRPWPRETFQVRRYYNRLLRKWQPILERIPAPDEPKP